MSFDVFFQGFRAGEASSSGGTRIAAVLEPFVEARDESDGLLLRIRTSDGQADVHLSEDSMMVSHASGSAVWELLVRGARAANWVIMPVGCPVCLTRAEQYAELPVELRDDTRLVSSGEDLLAAIAA